jgi:hypothetical protein
MRNENSIDSSMLGTEARMIWSARLRLYLILHLLRGLAADVKRYPIVRGGIGQPQPQKTMCRL